MPFVREKPLTFRGEATKGIAAAVVGLAAGLISRSLRGGGPIHWETLISMLLLLVICLGLTLTYWRVRFARSMGPLAAYIVTLWLTYGFGWSLVHGSIWDDMVGVVFLLSLGSIAGAAVIQGGMRYFMRLQYGPYCPKCNYHLVGLLKQICPECGRPFTLKELGVDESELHAAG